MQNLPRSAKSSNAFVVLINRTGSKEVCMNTLEPDVLLRNTNNRRKWILIFIYFYIYVLSVLKLIIKECVHANLCWSIWYWKSVVGWENKNCPQAEKKPKKNIWPYCPSLMCVCVYVCSCHQLKRHVLTRQLWRGGWQEAKEVSAWVYVCVCV